MSLLTLNVVLNIYLRVVGWEYGHCPLGPIEIDGLLMPPGKAYTLLTDHLITGEPLWSEPAQNIAKSYHPYI